MHTRATALACTLVGLTLALHGCSGGGGGGPVRDTVAEPSPDLTAPVITLLGGARIDHEQGTTYTDPGATATDAVDGTVTVATTGSVGSGAGTYTLTYTATDRAGNSVTAQRTVVVADTTPPLVTLFGAPSVNHPQGNAFADPGVSAVDAVDGAVAVTINGSVGTDAGTYTLLYTAVDAVGNSASALRTVVVAQDTAAESTDLLVYDDGAVDRTWDLGINAFDAALGFDGCSNDGGAACPSIDWRTVTDDERGRVLEVSHTTAGNLAGLYIATQFPLDLSGFAGGSLVFDIKVTGGDSHITMKVDCVYPCTSGEQDLGRRGTSGWETVSVPLATLTSGGLDLTRVNTGIVIWATNTMGTAFRLDNVRFTGFDPAWLPPQTTYTLTAYGAGNVSDTINPASYRCSDSRIYNAGVIDPAIAGCNGNTPVDTPTRLSPQLTAPATSRPTPTHRWWGSVSFLGEMTVGDPNDAAYITPDPLIARISNRGARLMGIPSGLRAYTDDFGYPIPRPFDEVFDGVAVGNTDFSDMDAFVKDHSDGAVTIEWRSGAQTVMQGTFVHGSPYAYFKAYTGELVVRTLDPDGAQKGIFYREGNSLGVWTNISGNHHNFLITGEGNTSFSNVAGNAIVVSNAAQELTLTYLPQISGVPTDTLTRFFEGRAREVVTAVDIDYAVDRTSNTVTVSHEYLGTQGAPVETLVGMHPLHWKHSTQSTSPYSIRSARGIIRFSETHGFTYRLSYVGALPALPSISGTFDQTVLERLIGQFVAEGPNAWNRYADTYWAGKSYGKVAEVIAIAESIGMDAEATGLREWLKAELADWFTAQTGDRLDVRQYFVYDEQWDTLLGLDESFDAHQQLNDHHFHYGYFVRAAAEICRVDRDWCGAEQFGPMIELLIRDYAGDDDDPMFPYLRHFDPANGFSWASGRVNFTRGNNNESTSEAANAYGAIVLYGLVVGRDDLVDKGMYLHASTAATYWQYWNNIDGYGRRGTTQDNFPPGYHRIAVSIGWGDGGAFTTWFSRAYAHILGIQATPSNPLIMYLGQHPDYLIDFVTLGLTESSNMRPSGLPEDRWRDLWWNLWAMADADAAIADYETLPDYTPEAGESRAHTYHWLRTFNRLGKLSTGPGGLTANYPAALAFTRNGVTSYVVYNFTDRVLNVTYSDGQVVSAGPQRFTVISN